MKTTICQLYAQIICSGQVCKVELSSCFCQYCEMTFKFNKEQLVTTFSY